MFVISCMKTIVLAGMDPVRDLEALQKKLIKKKREDNETYLIGTNKAKIPIIKADGLGEPTTCLDLVVQNVLDAQRIDEGVVVVGYDLKSHLPEGFHFVQQGDDFAANLALGYEALRRLHGLSPDEHVLVLNADLPKANGQVLDDMIFNSQFDLNADFVMSCVGEEVLDSSDYPRKYLQVIDDYFGNGEKRNMKESNFFFVNGNVDFGAVGEIYDYRKMNGIMGKLKFASFLARKLGPRVIGEGVLRLISQQQTVSYVADMAPRLIHTTFALIENYWKELQMDMDSEEDIKRLGYRICTEEEARDAGLKPYEPILRREVA